MTVTEPRTSSSPYEYVGEEMSLVEHLTELRTRLFRAVLAITVGFVVGFVFHQRVLELLTRPYCSLPESIRRGATVLSGSEECSLVALKVTDGFMVSLKAAAIVALVLAAPVVFYQILRFITPGLRPIERRYAIPFVVASQLLFAGGAAFSYFLIPKALQFLLGFAGPSLVPLLSGNEYLSFLLHAMLAFGVAFEFPLVLMILSLMGVVTAGGMRSVWRYAVFGIFVGSAVLTPQVDPISMSAMAAPLILFYGISILFAMLVERRRNAGEHATLPR